MANCSGANTISPTGNCFSNSNPSVFSQKNCGCTPCDAPVVIHKGDVSTQVLVPVLADVIQNCICVSKYEPAYPTNWVFRTNLLKAGTSTQPVPSGTICITDVSYSYSCIGVPSNKVSGDAAPTPPVINASVAGSNVSLSASIPSCHCSDMNTGKTTYLYNNFSGTTTTPACCCNNVAQAYAQTKVIERSVSFSVCNLNVSVKGTIGGQEFTANLVGTLPHPGPGPHPEPGHHPPTHDTLNAFANPTPLGPDLGFPASLNFAGIMCLPTSTKMTISEEFDNCLIVDCVRPNNATYSVANDPTGCEKGSQTSTYASFVASADLSLVISKTIYATVSQKLAVMTNSGAQVVCSNNNTVPACPQGKPCSSRTPCPGPKTTD